MTALMTVTFQLVLASIVDPPNVSDALRLSMIASALAGDRNSPNARLHKSLGITVRISRF